MKAQFVREHLVLAIFGLLGLRLTEALCGQPAGLQFQPTPAYLQFSDPVYSVAEDQTNAIITIIRTGEYRQPVSVECALVEGTAKAGRDYSGTNATVVIPAGAGLAEFAIRIHADDEIEEPETVLLRLSNPSPNGFIVQGEATLIIHDAAGPEAVAPPPLSIQAGERGRVLLSWPVTAENCRLEKSDGPDSLDWKPVEALPNPDATRYTVVEEASQNSAFYRLRAR